MGGSHKGAPVGVLMLKTQFPRPLGDIGNPATFDGPMLYKVVEPASAARVVRADPSALLPDFIAAGQALIEDGAAAITTSCGFLSLFQAELAQALSVPVATSSLLQVAPVNALLAPGKQAGVLTISGSTLSPAHLAAAGVPPDTPVGSTEAGRVFTRAILGDWPDFDTRAAGADCVAAARSLLAEHPDLGALVLECTNMGPYAPDIRAATGLPVYSIVTLVAWLQAGLLPRPAVRRPAVKRSVAHRRQPER